MFVKLFKRLFSSWAKNKKGIAIMILSGFIACLGQLCWKLSVTSEYPIAMLVLGVGVFLISAAFMIDAYRYGKVSILQPMLSVNYIISLIIGHFLFKENIKPINILGVAIIIFGVLLISGGDVIDD